MPRLTGSVTTVAPACCARGAVASVEPSFTTMISASGTDSRTWRMTPLIESPSLKAGTMTQMRAVRIQSDRLVLAAPVLVEGRAIRGSRCASTSPDRTGDSMALTCVSRETSCESPRRIFVSPGGDPPRVKPDRPSARAPRLPLALSGSVRAGCRVGLGRGTSLVAGPPFQRPTLGYTPKLQPKTFVTIDGPPIHTFPCPVQSSCLSVPLAAAPGPSGRGALAGYLRDDDEFVVRKKTPGGPWERERVTSGDLCADRST